MVLRFSPSLPRLRQSHWLSIVQRIKFNPQIVFDTCYSSYNQYTIVIVGNTEAHVIDSCLQYNLLPTVCSRDVVREIASSLEGTDEKRNVTHGTQ